MREKKSLPIIFTIIIVIFGVVAIIMFYNKWNSEEITVNHPVVQKVTTENDNLNLKSIIYEAEKNVIQIEGQNDSSQVTGSGFLYNDKGDIITNAHVIKDADIIHVRTANARVYPAAIVGISEDTDIAVIRVPQLASEATLEIEENDVAEIGDEVIALGSPHGFQNTVTIGIISGTERNFTVDGYEYVNLYQISASITNGNSGGPLINRETGKIIGINSVGTEDGTIGFSIPITEVIDQIEQWSNEVKNDELDFASTSNIIHANKPELEVDDAEYLVNYFLESITIRDYVSAYALLGSSLQLDIPYPDFRNTYINIIDIDYQKLDSSITNDQHILTNMEITVEKRLQKDYKTTTETYQLDVEVGYENGQMKILSINEVEN